MPVSEAPNVNVDPAEIARFSDLAAQWWDPEGPSRALHAMNPVRLGFLMSQAALDGRDALDIGCGGGIFSEALAAAGARVTGVDLSAEQLEIARQHATQQELNITYQAIGADQMAAQQPQHWPVITCCELLEHVPDPARLVQDCATLLQPGGGVLFSTINRTARAFAGAIVGAEYLLGILPKGTHRYAQFIRPSELAGWCRAAGLSLTALRGITYNPLSGAAGLSGDVGINYLAWCIKPDA